MSFSEASNSTLQRGPWNTLFSRRNSQNAGKSLRIVSVWRPSVILHRIFGTVGPLGKWLRCSPFVHKGYVQVGVSFQGISVFSRRQAENEGFKHPESASVTLLCQFLLCSWGTPVAEKERNSIASRGVPSLRGALSEKWHSFSLALLCMWPMYERGGSQKSPPCADEMPHWTTLLARHFENTI